jgi:acyl-CoA thioesterase FadM
MNLYIRLLTVLIRSLFKPKLPPGIASCDLSLRVMPNDLDINFHMNNGRYLTICDLTRMDFFFRTGLLGTMKKNKWVPVIAEHTMTYKKSLRIFQKYDVYMELKNWDDKYFYMSHVFKQGDRLIAEGTSKGAVLSRSGVIPPQEVIIAVKRYRGIEDALNS